MSTPFPDSERAPFSPGGEPPNERTIFRDFTAIHAMSVVASTMRDGCWNVDELAARAYDIADAMLRAREGVK